jgi:hypothetical protein
LLDFESKSSELDKNDEESLDDESDNENEKKTDKT